MSETTNTPAPSPYEFPSTDGKPDVAALLDRIPQLREDLKSGWVFPVTKETMQVTEELEIAFMDALESLARENAFLKDEVARYGARLYDATSMGDAARAECDLYLNSLERIYHWAGPFHDQGCPEDDTCSCSWKEVNCAVGEMIAKAREKEPKP